MIIPSHNDCGANGIIVLPLIQESSDKIDDILRQLHPLVFELQRYSKPARRRNLCKSCKAPYAGIRTRPLGTAIL